MSYDYKHTLSGGATIQSNDFGVIENAINFERKYEHDEKEWVEMLRRNGFKAAHPNDGWVNREENKVQLVYPQFDDGLKVGDKMMLGWHSDEKYWRPIRIIEKIESTIFRDLIRWKFQDLILK